MTKSLSWALIGLLAMGTGIWAAAPGTEFEVASMKRSTEGAPPGDTPRNMDNSPGHLAMHNVPLRFALEWAYDLKDYQIQCPEWMKFEEHYDIEARAAGGATNDQMRPMLQALLLERLKMKVHVEKKEFSVYLLTRGNGPLKVKPAAGGDPSLSGGPNAAEFHNQPISRFTFLLTRRLDRPVLDRTGLDGVYDYSVDLSGLGFNGGMPQDTSAPSIFTTVQRDMGLKLEAKKEMLDVLVIDHAEKTPIEK